MTEYSLDTVVFGVRLSGLNSSKSLGYYFKTKEEALAASEFIKDNAVKSTASFPYGFSRHFRTSIIEKTVGDLQNLLEWAKQQKKGNDVTFSSDEGYSIMGSGAPLTIFATTVASYKIYETLQEFILEQQKSSKEKPTFERDHN